MAEGGYEYTTVPEVRFEEEDHKSIPSRSSKASISSSSTQTAIKDRAKAEASRSKFAYAQRATELKVDHQSHRKSLSPQTRLQRTEHYVQDLSSLKSNSHNPHASSYQGLTLATSDIKQPVAPILYTFKLSFNLQDKWVSLGSKYKVKNNVAFPPFALFVDFIHREARVKADPSFNLPPSRTAAEKKERFDRQIVTSPARGRGGNIKPDVVGLTESVYLAQSQ